MRYSVSLESPFAFSTYWYAVGAGLIIAGVVLWFLCGKYLGGYLSRLSARWRRKSIPKKRAKYLQRIEGIEAAFARGDLDTRGVCQQMSREVREFVYAVTGWRTDTMVYLELSRLSKPELAELVRQYYEPEFAYYSEADAKLAIEKGKELIRKWE